MKYLLSILYLFNVILCEIEATTNDGKKVILSDDGTWKYLEEKIDSQVKSNMKFKFIAREVEPQAYPGFRVEDFVEYPTLAKEAGIEGRVIVAAFINKKGIPKNIYIVKGVSESLDREALDAVKKSRWVPAKQDEQRIGVWVNIPVSFRLK
tara:strand:- start:1926 stop:2378 length:453 start_codon:yes stop_codon:yes gene_type:complete